MIPVGYMAKHVSARPEHFEAEHVVDIYSVSDCISDNFADFIPYWKHNGFWFFDSPEIIHTIAREHDIDLSGTTLFFYEVYESEFHEEEGSWESFEPETSISTQVVEPLNKHFEGYDVVSFYVKSGAECSPLSCNLLAAEEKTNRHCLLDSLERAQQLLEQGKFKNAEPGPYRIFAVYSVDWP